MESNVYDTEHWPPLAVAGWAPTKRSLHLYAQMIGKMRLGLCPPQPNWMFTPLYFTARGLTTGAMPFGGTSVDALLDVFSSEIVVRRSTGEERRVPLVPPRSVAEIFSALRTALDELGVTCTISDAPQEMADATPFSQDARPAAYDPAAVQRWFRAATATAGVFDDWRGFFFGRSGIQLWWGAFDVALVLFNGRHVTAPADRGYLMKYDLDAELMNCGLFLGDETTAPVFYGYIYPQPSGAERFAMAPAAVSWSTAMSEWLLPYDAVRSSPSPAQTLRAFLDSLYDHCIADAGWDRQELSYTAPPARAR
jgi:hypothetical protein